MWNHVISISIHGNSERPQLPWSNMSNHSKQNFIVQLIIRLHGCLRVRVSTGQQTAQADTFLSWQRVCVSHDHTAAGSTYGPATSTWSYVIRSCRGFHLMLRSGGERVAWCFITETLFVVFLTFIQAALRGHILNGGRVHAGVVCLHYNVISSAFTPETKRRTLNK